MKKEITVLSCFDGISCGMVVLEQLGFKVKKYYASEIDKYTTQISEKNYPEIIRLGDINNWKEWNIDWSEIDLIMGGSPCQSFSFAGNQLQFEDPRGQLFFVFNDIINKAKQNNPNVKFFMENVKMNKDSQNVISEHLGVEPILINSALVSAQNRNRLYWFNWECPDQPKDRGIYLKDILQPAEEVKGNFYLSSNDDLSSNITKLLKEELKNSKYRDNFKWEIDKNRRILVMRPDGLKIQRIGRICIEHISDLLNKSECLNTIQQQRIILRGNSNIFSDVMYRKLTPIECERLQTLPDNYTEGVSNSQRYKALGNCWNIETIKHIMKHLTFPK